MFLFRTILSVVLFVFFFYLGVKYRSMMLKVERLEWLCKNYQKDLQSQYDRSVSWVRWKFKGSSEKKMVEDFKKNVPCPGVPVKNEVI